MPFFTAISTQAELSTSPVLLAASDADFPQGRTLYSGDGVYLYDGGAGGLFAISVDSTVLRTGADISVNSLTAATTITAGGDVTASGNITGANLSGTNTGNQTITLTGAVTGSGTGSFATSYNSTVPLNKGGTNITSATAGGVFYAASTSAFGQDASNFTWDATNHRLGLGTNSPNQQLELTGHIRLSSSIATTPSALYMGATKWFHTYGETSTESTNLFLGPNSGNTSLTRGTAVRNIAIGRSCLGNLTSGSYNLSFGDQCGRFITSGQYNVNIGDTAGYSTDTGGFNLNIGAAAGYSITSSTNNVNIGNAAGAGVTTATGGNIALGAQALRQGNVSETIAIGASAYDSGSGTPSTGNSCITIGHAAQSQYCTPAYGPTTTPNLASTIVIGRYACTSVSHGCVLGLWSDTSTFGGVGTHAPAAQWHSRANRTGQTALIADGWNGATVDIAKFRTTTDGSLSGSGSGTWTDQLVVTKDGDLAFSLGRTSKYKTGTNATAGTATLVSGTVTVSTTAVLTGDVIEFSRQSFGSSTAVGQLGVTALTNGTSFVVTSKKADMSGTETGDASVVWWRIVRPF